jgi:IS5 family transposase
MKKGTSCKKKFLSEMDKYSSLGIIDQAHLKAGNARPLYDSETMLCNYFMQQWHHLIGPTMEDSLYNIESMRRFAKISLDQIPDESAMLNFHHLLEKDALTNKLSYLH